VHEAAALQADLRRAQIEPFAWVINQSFARTETRDPLLLARGAGERPFIQEVTRDCARRTAIVPWVPEEPVGPAKLQQLFRPSPKS
jgi:arsenite-transporting ATPase